MKANKQWFQCLKQRSWIASTISLHLLSAEKRAIYDCMIKMNSHSMFRLYLSNGEPFRTIIWQIGLSIKWWTCLRNYQWTVQILLEVLILTQLTHLCWKICDLIHSWEETVSTWFCIHFQQYNGCHQIGGVDSYTDRNSSEKISATVCYLLTATVISLLLGRPIICVPFAFVATNSLLRIIYLGFLPNNPAGIAKKLDLIFSQTRVMFEEVVENGKRATDATIEAMDNDIEVRFQLNFEYVHSMLVTGEVNCVVCDPRYCELWFWSVEQSVCASMFHNHPNLPVR